MKKSFSMIIALGSLALVGAGCGSDESASLSLYNEKQSPLSPPVNLSVAEQVHQAQSTSSPSILEELSMPKTWVFPGVLPPEEISGKQIHMMTSKGEIVFELHEKDAPKTVSNFVNLAKGGFYDGLTFHRREEGFVIQGGDPLGNGTGGPGYKFEDEPVKRPYKRGTVAMANSGPDTNGSQFFIMLDDMQLPPKYTIFGMVTSGLDVVDQIKVGDEMTKVSVEAK